MAGDGVVSFWQSEDTRTSMAASFVIYNLLFAGWLPGSGSGCRPDLVGLEQLMYLSQSLRQQPIKSIFQPQGRWLIRRAVSQGFPRDAAPIAELG